MNLIVNFLPKYFAGIAKEIILLKTKYYVTIKQN